MIESCAQCKYWMDMLDDGGTCRRHPPTVVIEKQVNIGEKVYTETTQAYPGTADDGWCGEFKHAAWHGEGPS